jgi:hypothetical protein
MLKHTIEKLEESLKNVESIQDERKTELLNLLSTLKVEIDDLAKTHNEYAESITGFAELSTREATRRERNPDLIKLSIEGLGASVQGFETSHPKLVEVVNAICSTLSNLGI